MYLGQILRKLFNAAVVALVLFLVGAFSAQSLDPAEWHFLLRGLIGFLMGFVSLVVWAETR